MLPLSPEKKLRYLSEYMNEWVDLWPKRPKPAHFDGWVDSRVQKKVNKRLHEQKEKLRTICVYCRRPFDETYINKTKDHIIPMSKGGLNVKENRRPCCGDCNQWKKDKLPRDWMKEITKLLKSERDIREPYSRIILGTMISNIKRVISDVEENWKKVSMYKF